MEINKVIEIMEEGCGEVVEEILKDIEERIKSCLKDTKKQKEKGMPPNMN